MRAQLCDNRGMAAVQNAAEQLVQQAYGRPGVAEALRVYEFAAARVPVPVHPSVQATFSTSANASPSR